ncbi:hypothetical protein HDK77DRAFT_487399 [Phyllosticta capitalensis]
MVKDQRALKICVSSRPYAQFENMFKATQSLQLHYHTRDDIRAYIDSRFRAIPGELWGMTLITQEDRDACLQLQPKFLERLSPQSAFREEVAKKSEGIFLWVQLVISRLEKQVSGAELGLKQLIDRMSACSGELYDLFDQLWDEIDAEDQEEGLVYITLLRMKGQTVFWDCVTYGHLPLLREQWMFPQDKVGSFEELSITELNDLELRAQTRLKKCCGLFLEFPKVSNNFTRVSILHQSVSDYFWSDHFLERRGISLENIKEKAGLCAAFGMTMQLWNSAHPRHERSFDEIRYTISLGVEIIVEFFGREKKFHLGMGLYQAATSPRLLSSSFEVAAETCGEIYPRGPRVNPFGEICLLEFWQTEYLTYLLFHPSGMSQCSATEVLFHLFVVGFPPRELMIVWNTDDLQRKWKKEVQGMNAWNGCLVTLIFFNIFYMRPFLSNPGTAFAEIKRCPKEIAEILHGPMVQLIKERKIYDNDRTFNEVTELHAILSRDWNELIKWQLTKNLRHRNR